MPEAASLASSAPFLKTRDRLCAAILTPVAPLQMTRWLTPEPVPFAERMTGLKKAVKAGDRWGEALFDCAWFRFRGAIPAGLGGGLAARIDLNGELLIVDADGRPMRSLTNVTSEFARCHGEPGKVEFPVLPEMAAGGNIEFWADAAFNDLFGGLQGDGRIVHAEICTTREDVRALYYDFEVLCDILEELADDAPLCEKVSSALAKAGGALGENLDEDEVAAARQIIAPLFQVSENCDSLQIWAIGHAHLDLAWLWPVRETARKGIRTFSTALANRELYPEHILGMSQPQLYDWIKQRDPEFYERVRQGVKSGSVEIQGRFWVEPDCNIPNGESLVRQVLCGSRFFKEEFGFVPSQCWQPDVFGYNGQLPQILAKSGHDVFMTQKLSWNMVNRFPHHSFHWEGIDGTSVLTHMLPEETYNGPAAPRSLKKIRDEYAERDVSGHALMCYGIGDGGAGPGIEHLERLRRLAAFETLPKVKISGTPAFFEEWKKDAGKFPRWKGELYLEKHQGTLTTQALAKKNNRLCEISLRELELISVFAEARTGHAYPAPELDAIWKEVLLYQFHDILPGSSIKRVYDESAPRYAAILNRIAELADAAYQALSKSVPGESTAAAFNPLSHARTGWIRHGKGWHHLTIPPFASTAIPPAPSPVTGMLRALPDLLENDLLRVTFAADGSIPSLFDKRTATELLPPARTACRLTVFPDKGDAWDFDADIPARNVWRFMEEKPLHPTLVSAIAEIDGPCATILQTYRVGASAITQRITLQAGGVLLEFETEVDWQEKAHMLKVVFPTVVSAGCARFEIPFGSIRRSTREDDTVTRAQFEVPAHQWIDLCEPGRGLAMFNDCKYGFRVKNGQMEMTALRSVPHPGCAVVTADESGIPGQSAHLEYGDLGHHRFRYAIQPHDGTLAEAELTATARAFNSPPRIIRTPPLPPLISISHPNLELTCCKKGETVGHTVLRLCNISPETAISDISIRLPCSAVWEADLLENKLSPLDWCGGVRNLEFSPFEVKTLLLL